MWTPEGSPIPAADRRGWSIPGPDVPLTGRTGWFAEHGANGYELAVSRDYGTVWVTVTARDIAAAMDYGLALVEVTGIDVAATAERGFASTDAYGRELAAARDHGIIGVTGREVAAAGDFGAAIVATQGRETTAAADRGDANTSSQGRELSATRDQGTGGFGFVAPVTTQFTAVGNFTYTIPVACRYLDLVALGAGAGGQGAGWIIRGDGGKPGDWAGITLERGIDIPWTLLTLTGFVGAGGARGSGGAVPGAGQAGGASAVNSWISAAGGADSNNTGTQDGLSPGNYAFGTELYVGGGVSTGTTAQVPGSGGRGGNVSSGNGNVGGRGQVWIRAYQ